MWFEDSPPGENLALVTVCGGNALSRHALVGVVEAVLLLLLEGTSGVNPRSHVGSGEGYVSMFHASWGLVLDVPPARVTRGSVLVVVGGGELLP